MNDKPPDSANDVRGQLPAPPARPDLPETGSTGGIALASLVMGILAWPLTVLWLGWIAATLAIIFGVEGRRRAAPGSSRMKIATWGMGLGIANLVALVAILSVLSSAGAP